MPDVSCRVTLRPPLDMASLNDFDTIFTPSVRICSSKFMAGGYTVESMNTMILRARQMSLALIVTAVIDHGHLQADYSGATPRGSGLTRLGRDLMRRAGGEVTPDVAGSPPSAFTNSTLALIRRV